MKTTDTAKSIPSKNTAKSKTTATRRPHRGSKTAPSAKLVYALYALVALSLAVNILATVTFVAYTRALSAPPSVGVATTPSSLSSAAGWLPSGAEEVKAASDSVQPKKTDLDMETIQPATQTETPKSAANPTSKPPGQDSSEPSKKASAPRQPPRS